MKDQLGVPALPSGHSAEPEPAKAVSSAIAASVPNAITQSELNALVEAAQPEPWARQREREDAQLRLQRLWDEGVLKLDQGFNYVLAGGPR